MYDFPVGPGLRLAQSGGRLPVSEGQTVGEDGLLGFSELPML